MDFFISSFQPESVKSTRSLLRNAARRGSDHFPIQIEIDLEHAPEREIKMLLCRKHLAKATQQTQEFLRTQEHTPQEIRRQLLSIQSGMQKRSFNPKQFRRNLNASIKQIIAKELREADNEKTEDIEDTQNT